MTFKDTKIRLIADFTIEMVEERKQYSDMFKILKENNYQYRSLLLIKASFKNEIIERCFQRNKQTKFLTSSPALNDLLFKA